MDSVEPPDTVVLADSRDRLEAHVGTLLREHGYAVRSVDAASECLRLVEDRAASGVVSTDELADLDGLRLCRALRLVSPAIPFVLVPFAPDADLEEAAYAAGVSGYVPADWEPSTVVSRLRGEGIQAPGVAIGEGHKRYRELLLTSPAPINIFDGEGRIIWGNDAVLDLLGLDHQADLVGRSIFEFIHPADHDLAGEELGDVVAEKRAVGPTEMRLLPPDGNVRHIQVSTAVGRFFGADIGQAVVVDVTELRATRRALEDERRLMESALDALEDVFFVVGPDGRLERWNEQAVTVSGYDDGGLPTMALEQLFIPADRERIRQSIDRTLETGADVVEATVVASDGREIPFEFRCRRLAGDEAGDRVVGIGRNVSERRERERHMRAIETWLRHNIRNRLNLVGGIAEDMEAGAPDVADEASRIQTVVADLLHQSDRGRELIKLLTDPPDRAQLDLQTVVESAVDDARRRYPDADVAVPELEPCRVRAIPQLEAAVRELLANAVDHQDADDPEVRVTVGRADDAATLTVADDGPGIPEQELETLFYDREMDQLHHGSGMGLLYVYWVTRLSDAGIEFDGPEAGSTTVTIRLAAADGGPALGG